MRKINLKDMYYFLNQDEDEIVDDVYKVLEEYQRYVHAQNERIRRNKAYFSLDRNPYLEIFALNKVKNPLQIAQINEIEDELLDTIVN